MSELSYLEKLLEGIEVEWFPLGKVAKKIYSGGTPDTKKIEYWEHGTIPWMSSGEVNLKTIKETEKFITEDGLNNSSAKFVPENSIVMALAGQGKTRGKVARTRIKLTTNQSLAAITFDERKFNSDYIFHFLETQYDNLRQISSGNSGRGGLNLQMISAYKAPIPCPGDPEKSLAIQSEIVRILDKFTALTAELTAELTARKKQYNYYRDQLLSFEEGDVEWKTLGEIGTWHGGGTPSKSRSEFWENGSIPWISPKDMGRPIVDTSEDYITEEAVQQSSTKLVPANSIAIVVRSSILDKVMPSALIPVPATFNQDMKVVIPHCNISPNYIAHIMRSRGGDILRAAKKSGGSVASIDSKKLFSFRIPVPHLNEQKRIVNILDKFDTLANSITEGLPREIELRQKQYEYYRDLLFSFPKPDYVTN